MDSKSGFQPAGKAPQIDPQHDLASLDPKLSRTHYFDGRLLKASDLTRDQEYLDERLREVGRAVGSGIVHGLQVSLDNRDQLHVSPGLAIAPSGRALELEGESLSIDLHDSAAIAANNPDSPARIPRGLYAVTLEFVEVGSEEVSEVYPRDLEGQRGFHVNAWSEGVQVSLTPLRQSLPNASANYRTKLNPQHALAARSALVREFVSNPGQPVDLPEDAVALGLLAIEHERPLWLDMGLVRRPHRHPHSENALQQDLYRHYQELLNDVVQARIDRGLHGEFPASHHFRVLPPYGSLPKNTLDPETGRQAWFPAGYEVSVAPVRLDDLDAILAESAALDPIDLEKDDDVDIMVLVPLSDHQFAWRARQLQHREELATVETHTVLPHLDRLALRLYDVAQPPVDSTDAAIWRAIWAEIDQPMYVRRPPRVAETLVSGVVLASGYRIPEGLEELPPDMEENELQLNKLREELAARERAIERHMAEIEALREKLKQSASERLQAAEKQVNKLKDQLEQALVEQDELLLLRKQHAQQKAEIKKLLDRLAALEDEGDGSSESKKLLERIEQLRTALADAEEQIAMLRKQLASTGGGGLPSIATLVALRGGDTAVRKAATALAESVSDNAAQLLAVHQIAQLIDWRYDSLLFTTLVEVAQKKGLLRMRDNLPEFLPAASVATAMTNLLPMLGVSGSLVKQWQALEKQLGSADAQTIRELKEEIARLNKQLQAGTGSDAASEEEIKRLQATLAEAEAKIKDLQGTVSGTADQQKKIDQLQQDLAAAEKTIEQLKAGGTTPGEPFKVDFRKVKVRPLADVWEERQAAMKRHSELDAITLAAEKVIKLTVNNELRLARANHILAITPPQYDPALWRSLQTILSNKDGTPFRSHMVKLRQSGVDIGLAVAASTDQKLSSAQKSLWYKIDLPK